MTVLRQRMLDDIRIRNLAAETQTSYLRQVAKFARYHGQSPERLGPEDIRTYQLHLIDDRQLAPTSVAGTVAALRFLYQVTLKRDWACVDASGNASPFCVSWFCACESAARVLRDNGAALEAPGLLPLNEGPACWLAPQGFPHGRSRQSPARAGAERRSREAA